jgi:hypothetical protein
MRAEERRRLLEHALMLVGGAEQLADKLAISPRLVEHYLSGAGAVPDALFVRLVDVLAEYKNKN